MAQRIKIAKVEVKEGDNTRGHWRNFIITGEDNTKVSTFDPSASGLKEGDIIEGEIGLKGKFANLKSFKLVEHSEAKVARVEPPKVAPAKEQPVFSHETRSVRDTSIEAQVAVKELGECIRAGTTSVPRPLVTAYWRWVSDKLGIFTEPAGSEAETLPSVPESVRKAVAEESVGNLPIPDSPPTTERKEFENIGDLLSECAKIKTAAYPKGVSRQTVLDILGIKSVDDLRGLNLDNAWQKIQEYIEAP